MLPDSGSPADIIAAAAALREQTALDAFDGLSRAPSIGMTELAQALWQVAEMAMDTSIQRAGKPAVVVSPRKREASRQQLDDFLKKSARGNEKPANFSSFVSLYNEFVDHAGLVPSSGSPFTSPRGDRHSTHSLVDGLYDGSEDVDPRVRDKAHSINAKMAQSRSERSNSPRVLPRGPTASNRLQVVSSSADAPQIKGDVDEAEFDGTKQREERRRRSSDAGKIGLGRLTQSPRPEDSPSFVRAGVEKFDFSKQEDKEKARLSAERKRDSPSSSRNASGHGGSMFTPSMSTPSSRDASGAAAAGPVILGSELSLNTELPALPTRSSVGGGGGSGQSRARSSAFRERRLSKDIVNDSDDEDDGHENADGRAPPAPHRLPPAETPEPRGFGAVNSGAAPDAITLPRQPLLDEGAASALSSSSPSIDNAAIKQRRLSLNQLVMLEKSEAEMGSPNPIDAIARAIDSAEPIHVKCVRCRGTSPHISPYLPISRRISAHLGTTLRIPPAAFYGRLTRSHTSILRLMLSSQPCPPSLPALCTH